MAKKTRGQAALEKARAQRKRQQVKTPDIFPQIPERAQPVRIGFPARRKKPRRKGPKPTPTERRKAARVTKRQKEWQKQARKEFKKQGQIRSSSFITALQYDPEFWEVEVRINTQWYAYLKVPPIVFEAWKAGAATCVTDDATGRKRWWVGKTPSLGAFYNANIKGRYKSDKLAAPGVLEEVEFI